MFLCGWHVLGRLSAARLTSDNWADLTPTGKVLDYLWHITLPVFAAVISQFAIKTMLTKNSFLEEIGKHYVLTARAKGLSERRVLWKHVFRNSLLPLVTGFPAAFIAAFFTGSLLIETLFSLDGLGLLAFESIKRRDYPVVMGTLYLFTIVGLVAKLLGDIGLRRRRSSHSFQRAGHLMAVPQEHVWIRPRCHRASPRAGNRRAERASSVHVAEVQAQQAQLLQPADPGERIRPEPLRGASVPTTSRSSPATKASGVSPFSTSTRRPISAGCCARRPCITTRS